MYDSRASIRGHVTRAPVRPVIIIIIIVIVIIITDLSLGGAVLSPSGETLSLLHLGAGTIKLEMASSLRAESEGGGGHTMLSIKSSVVLATQLVRSGGSVLELLIIMHRDISSCKEDQGVIACNYPKYDERGSENN